MKKVIILLSIGLNIISIVLALNLFSIPINVKSDCGVGWLMMSFTFFYLPIAVSVSFISYFILRFSKIKILRQIFIVIISLIIVFEIIYSILRVQISNTNYICPERMKIDNNIVL